MIGLKAKKKHKSMWNKQGLHKVKYQNQFINEKYDRINLTVPNGDKAVIKRAAAAGESVNEYINQAITQRMENTSNA